MSVEDRIRQAMRAEAGGVDPTAEKWEAVQAGAAKAVRRRRLVRGGAAVAGVAAAVVAAIAIFNALGPVERGRVVGEGGDGPPEEFVAITQQGELQIRRTEDGEVVRTLRDDVDMSYGPPRIAASSDGRFVYTDRFELEDCPDGGARTQKIARVLLPSGEIEAIATGAEPALSADGRRLAYVTSSDTSACGHYDTLVVRELGSRTEQRWTANPSEPDWAVSMPYWSPDNRMIKLALLEGPSVSVRLIDTLESGFFSLADAHQVPVPEFSAALGYLTEDELLTAQTPEDEHDLVTIDPVSGDVVRRLVVIPGIYDDFSAVASRDGKYALLTLRLAGGRSEEDPVELLLYTVEPSRYIDVTEGVVAMDWLAPVREADSSESAMGDRVRRSSRRSTTTNDWSSSALTARSSARSQIVGSVQAAGSARSRLAVTDPMCTSSGLTPTTTTSAMLVPPTPARYSGFRAAVARYSASQRVASLRLVRMVSGSHMCLFRSAGTLGYSLYETCEREGLRYSTPESRTTAAPRMS